MEIMGLVVIVILLTLGMFFMIAFRTNKTEKEIMKTYDDDQLAANFIISTLKTSATCGKFTMEDLIQDCAVEKKINCSGMLSCNYVNHTMNMFVNQTLKKWGKKYNLTIITPSNNENITFVDNCTRSDEKTSNLQPINLYPYPGTVRVKLDICK